MPCHHDLQVIITFDHASIQIQSQLNIQNNVENNVEPKIVQTFLLNA